MPQEPQVFTHRHTVRFGEIDYAGIVYYPNFFDFFQQAEEEFMGHIGYPYHHLLGVLKQGFPILHVEADFKRPVRYGDVLEVDLTVARMGNSSVTFRFRARKAGARAPCAEAEIAHALIDTRSFKPFRIPDAMRNAFAAYASADAELG